MLWRAYALLSHGGDRLRLGSIGLLPWHRRVTPTFRRTGDVFKILEEADTAVWSASSRILNFSTISATRPRSANWHELPPFRRRSLRL
jgi:hypothetical protein